MFTLWVVMHKTIIWFIVVPIGCLFGAALLLFIIPQNSSPRQIQFDWCFVQIRETRFAVTKDSAPWLEDYWSQASQLASRKSKGDARKKRLVLDCTVEFFVHETSFPAGVLEWWSAPISNEFVLTCDDCLWHGYLPQEQHLVWATRISDLATEADALIKCLDVPDTSVRYCNFRQLSKVVSKQELSKVIAEWRPKLDPTSLRYSESILKEMP